MSGAATAGKPNAPNQAAEDLPISEIKPVLSMVEGNEAREEGSESRRMTPFCAFLLKIEIVIYSGTE
jgi:hypothetical protein